MVYDELLSSFFSTVYIAVLFGLKRDEDIFLEEGSGGTLKGFKEGSLAEIKANYYFLGLKIKSGLMMKPSFFLGYSV